MFVEQFLAQFSVVLDHNLKKSLHSIQIDIIGSQILVKVCKGVVLVNWLHLFLDYFVKVHLLLEVRVPPNKVVVPIEVRFSVTKN